MAFDKTDSGTLGENDFKQGDKHPDMTGKLEALSPAIRAAIAAGKPVRLAGWWKQGANGQWLSLKVSLERERDPAAEPKRDTIPGDYDWRKAEQRETAAAKQRQEPATETAGEFDDDIPF